MRRPGFLADANIFNLPGLINAPVPVAASIFSQREREKKRREMERDIYKKQRPPPLQPVLPPPALGIPTEHLVIGGLLAILLLRKDGLPIDNLLLPLAGVGAFLWYKNKTKEAPFMPHGVLPPTMPMRPPPDKIAFTTPLPPSAEESLYCAPSWGSLGTGEFSPGAVLIGTKEGDTIDAALLRIKAHPKLKDFNFSMQQQGFVSALIKVGSAIGDSKCGVTSEAVRALKKFGGLRYAEVNGIYRAT